MSVLNEAREKYGFKNVWTYDGRILYKDNNDGQKIKIYYDQNLFRGAYGQHLKWKKNQVVYFFLLSFKFLIFSLRGSETYFCWVNCFYFSKITVFIIGNAPLILKFFNNKTDIFFLIRKLLFFSYMLLFTVSLSSFLNYISLLKFLLLIYFCHCHVNHEW